MSQVPFARITDFLKGLPPFDSLDQQELAQVVQQMEVAFFPRSTVIVPLGSPPSPFLYLIQSGSAQLSLPQAQGEEVLVDLRAEGDFFGVASLLEEIPAPFQIKAREDLICYLLPADSFRQLVRQRPAFQRHFRSSLARDLSAAGRGEAGSLSPGALAGLDLEAAMVRGRVGEVMVREVLTCLPATTVRAAAHLMSMRRVSSMVVVEESGHPLGIITDQDLRAKVLARGLGPDLAVAEVMSAPLTTISAQDLALEALLLMSSQGVHHLPVVEQDRLVGIISDHDFQVLAGSSPLGVAREIAKVGSVEELVRSHAKMDRVLEQLLRLGGPAPTLLALVSHFNDRLTRRLLQLSEEEVENQGLGRPPVPYVWMALGSEGRREQTLVSDQDNALILANLPAQRLAPVKQWFLMFAERVVAGLEACGFPRCAGGVMAINPQWCQTESQWRETFLAWMGDPQPLTLRLASIFFDPRAIYAEADFMESITQALKQGLEEHRQFLRFMAHNALYNRPPLGFLRQFVVEKGGEHNNQLNLKLSGLTPIVDAARVLALDLGVMKTNTRERLAEVAQAGLIRPELAADLAEAFDFITILRISSHLQARAQGRTPDNFLDPGGLGKLQRKMLKESFAVISQLQDLLAYRYQTRLMN